MSDSGPVVKSGGGYAKASLGAVYLDLVQHITPPLAGWLNARYPILGDAVSYEIVVLAESMLSMVLVKFTPTHFFDSVKNGIISFRRGVKVLRDAMFGALPPDTAP